MTKWAPIAYTRTFYDDYKMFAHPQDKDINFWHGSKVEDAYHSWERKYTETPEFVTLHHNGYVIKGVICENKLLAPDTPEARLATKDKDSRPIRGFFGLVAKEPASDMPPDDLEIFKQVYAELYPRICKRGEGEFAVKTDYADIPRPGQSVGVAEEGRWVDVGTADKEGWALLGKLREGGTLGTNLETMLRSELQKRERATGTSR